MNRNTAPGNFIIFLLVSVFCYNNCLGQASISYHTPNIFTINVAISPLSPTITGGSATAFSINPSLSATGLAFNTATGIITGTPTKASDAEYNISATGVSKPFTIKITINPAAPNVTYTPVNTYIVGTPATELDPTIVGGSASKYSISPALPVGLSINPTTGAITGTPAVVSATTEYAVIAGNETSYSAPAKIKITVNPAAMSPSTVDYISMIVVFLFCFAILLFLLCVTCRSQKNGKEALGLPRGSVRAIIAILFVVFFALLAVVFYFDSDANPRSADLAKQILTILGTLVTAVSAFYFGAKATEQGHQIATDAFQQMSNQTTNDIPLDIIKEAIQNNKSDWITQYACEDIKAGKKVSNNTTQNINCIVFLVANKNKPNNNSTIPPTIQYKSGGKAYTIPTDVQEADDSSSAVDSNDPSADFKQLSEEDQVDKIHAAIKLYWDKWLHTINNITGVGIANKMIDKENKRTNQKVIQFHVSEKITALSSNFTSVPAFVDYSGFKIPTDVIQSDVMRPGSYAYPGNSDNPRVCGASISRNDAGNNATGTISLKLTRTEQGTKKYYLLTCCHVLMDLELNQGVAVVANGNNLIGRPECICPGADTGQRGIILGSLIEGKLNHFTDSALVLLDNPDELSSDIHQIGTIADTRSVDNTDVDVLQVKFCGAYSGLIENVFVRGYGLSMQGDYPSAVSSQYLNELIQLDRCSEDGDSGAAVVDSGNKIIGIIVGKNDSYTFVIPIQSIKSEHNQFQILN